MSKHAPWEHAVYRQVRNQISEAIGRFHFLPCSTDEIVSEADRREMAYIRARSIIETVRQAQADGAL